FEQIAADTDEAARRPRGRAQAAGLRGRSASPADSPARDGRHGRWARRLEARRQRRLGADPRLDRDPAATRLMARTCLPAAVAAVAAAVLAPSLTLPRTVQRGAFVGGLAVAVSGIGLRQWAIRTLGRLFVGYVAIQPDHHAVQSGPYRYLRHPSYTGIWLLI